MDNTLDYSRLTDQGRPFRVERHWDGSVEVFVCHTPRQRREMLLGAGASLLTTAVFVGGAWAVSGGWHGAAAALLLVLFPDIMVGRMVVATFCTHRFAASPEGLLIETTSPRRRRRRGHHVPRAALRDVVLRFGGRHPGGCSVVALRPRWWHPGRYLLRNIGGDNAAAIADALREGLVLPHAEWPGGRPLTGCRKCGYDLRATPGRCPGCGAEPAATP